MHTGPIPAIVSAEITLNLVVGAEYGVPVAAHFSYGAHEPLSVTAAFHAADSEVRWVFARDLLDEGTRHPTGEGDVVLAGDDRRSTRYLHRAALPERPSAARGASGGHPSLPGSRLRDRAARSRNQPSRH